MNERHLEQDGYYGRRERMKAIGSLMLLRAILSDDEPEATTETREAGRILELRRPLPAVVPVSVREAALR